MKRRHFIASAAAPLLGCEKPHVIEGGFTGIVDADAEGRYATRDGLWVGEQVGCAQVRHGVDQGHVCPRHCRGASATVGLEDIAVDPEGALAEFLKIDDGAQAAANETLDFNAAAIHLAP